MTEKKTIDKNQIWQMLMIIIPVVMLSNAAQELTVEGDMQIIYAALFGGIGGLIGFVAHSLTKDKGTNLKLIVTVSLIILSGMVLYIISR